MGRGAAGERRADPQHEQVEDPEVFLEENVHFADGGFKATKVPGKRLVNPYGSI
jgi:hypothetical protein